MLMFTLEKGPDFICHRIILVFEMATFPIHLLQSIEKYGSAVSPDDFKNVCEKLCQKLVDDGPSECRLFIC